MGRQQIADIGILGGSFDPPHNGHLKISKIAINKIKLKKLYWIITKKNPFKKKPLFSLRNRIVQSKKIVRNIKNIKVLYLENIVKSRRSIDIIKYILKKEKKSNIYLIIGSDILISFHKWKSWKKIVKLTKLIVFSRKGYDRKSKESIVAKYINKKNIKFIKNKPIKFSSSQIREKYNK